LPFALSIAATVQISRQLAKKRFKKARTTAYLCVLEGSALMALAALLMWALRDYSGTVPSYEHFYSCFCSCHTVEGFSQIKHCLHIL